MKQETRQTVFRQTQAEYEKLKNDAYAHRMNISEYLRYLIEKERKKEIEVDLDEVNPMFRHWYE